MLLVNKKPMHILKRQSHRNVAIIILVAIVVMVDMVAMVVVVAMVVMVDMVAMVVVVD